MARLIYAVLVLAVDTAMAMTNYRWMLGPFDLFKAVFWLALPLIWEWRTLDIGWYGLARVKRGDWVFLAAVAIVGAGAMLVIPHIASLRVYYEPQHGGWPFVGAQALWVASWLPGWEFLHRYFVLRALERRPWVVVALEGLYHLQKPLPEMLGMVALSIALTYWTRARRNGSPAFLAHLAIEGALVAFLALY